MSNRYLFKRLLLLAVAVILMAPVTARAIPKMGQQLPNFDVTTPGGQRVTNLNYGGRVLLLTFSTDYCSACKKAVPGIGELAARYGRKGFHVLGLLSGFGMDDDDLKEYMKRYGVTYPMALFEQRFASERFGMLSAPYFILVGKKGLVAGMYNGYSDLTMKQIEEQINRLLAE